MQEIDRGSLASLNCMGNNYMNFTSLEIIGFTELGNITTIFSILEQKGEHPDIAKYVLAPLVRGTLRIPLYAHFGTRGITVQLTYDSR